MKSTLNRFGCACALAALFLVSSSTSLALDRFEAGQAQWIKQAPVPTSFDSQGVAVISPNECWVASAALGGTGQLEHTTDAGRTWNTVSLPDPVLAIAFVDSLHGWTAGKRFSHTIDGGVTWIQDNSSNIVYDLFFLDTLHGWACGDGAVAYYTTDGGLQWTSVAIATDSIMDSIHFTDLLNGWLVDLNGHIFHSTDGGKNWSLKSSVTGTNMRMIQFFDSNEGWVIGRDKFYRTTDGGSHWTKSLVPTDANAYAARFFDRTNGVAVGELGDILRTTDGGVNWQNIQSPGSSPRLWDVEYADANILFLVGNNGVISRSTDAGESWNSIQSGATGVTHSFDAIDSEHVWAAQDGGEVAYTVNGGKQWLRASVQDFALSGKILAVAFGDASTGWCTGTKDAGGGSVGIISFSGDGGKTWFEQFEILDFAFKGLEAIDSLTAFATGVFDFFGGGVVVRTTDGGSNWEDITPNGEGFRGVFFLDATTGWIVGSNIYKTTDGGNNWTNQFGSGGSEFTSISFSDAQNGWAVGLNNHVLHTRDGGETWKSQDVGAPLGTETVAVSAVNSKTAWIAGRNGFVAHTTDGGGTWENEAIPGAADVDFEDVLFLDSKHGWVGGGDIGIWARR